MKKAVSVLKHFGQAMNEIYSRNNKLLTHFTLAFAVTITGPLIILASAALKITEAQRNIWLLMLLIITIISQYAGHWVYCSFIRKILISRGWREDSILDASMLVAIMFALFTFPFYFVIIFIMSTLS